jgi:PKD repeat protein
MVKFALRTSFSLILSLTGCVLWSLTASAQPFSPPPLPPVAPLISHYYANDTNGDRLDDALLARAELALAARKTALTPGGLAQADAALNGMVEVELVFKQQISQNQIDAFLAQGGKITYIYKAVSYGWNGWMPLGKAAAMPGLLGDSLLLIEESHPAVWHLDLATRNGRVRPIWNSGFANNPGGFDGNTNITIGIVDTGVDESHTDLNGRRIYWHDFTTDNAPTPVDFVQHGSHVTGIALGTGASLGSATGTFSLTDEGSLSGVASGSFFPNLIDLPAASITFTITARWNGGGSTTLHLVSHPKGTSSGFGSHGSVTGSSPLTLNITVTGDPTRAYTAALLSSGSMTDYVVTSQITNYPGSGDAFNKFRGVAPGCHWAGAKVFDNNGSGGSAQINAALDDLTSNRAVYNIKVMNMSIGFTGNPGLSTTTRQKVNTAVNDGIVCAVSSGNDGLNSNPNAREIDDPGRAAMALTVAAANDINQLTDYTSQGFTSPGSTAGQEEDYKPDLMAPGGSSYYTFITSVDSNSGDGTAFADQQANDYYNINGTSMASPFAAGCAALVIDALQQSGVTWDFSSGQHSRLVKMVLCATAAESNTNRESNANNQTLQRAAPGPNGFPAGKDQFEGFGMINPDAAVEAVTLLYTNGTTVSDTLGPGINDRRAWARTVNLGAGQNLGLTLTVPAGGDFDLYLYNRTPTSYGTPTIISSSTAAGNGLAETINFTSVSITNLLVVVKRVSGSGTFNLSSAGGPPVVDFRGVPTNGVAPLAVTFTNLTTGATNYSWVFGDGKTSTATNASNTYTNAGSYSVTLTGIGPGGTNSLTRNNYIVVTNAPPPIALFVGNPSNGLAPLLVSFTNQSSNANSYAWDFGDGKTSTAINPNNTYTNAGIYTVSLKAIGLGGTNTLTRTNYIVATNPPPVIASFSAAPTNGLAPLTVSFTNLSNGATNYNWAFGDGNFSTTFNPSHNYTNAGIYTASLTAVGLGGTNTFTRTNYIVATNPPSVIADFSATPTNGLVPLSVSFTNLSSAATNYSWNFGDGNFSTTLNPSHIYTNAGSYIVSLTAVGPGGTNTLTRTNYIVATNPLPVIADFNATPTNGLAPLSVSFTNLSSGATNYSWDFGDGKFSATPNPSHIYTNAASYIVSLTAVGLGGTNTLTRINYIMATNPPPVFADFSAAPTNGLVPLSVSFTNLSSAATNYTWAFGDGSISTLLNPSHTYTNAGGYTVSLTAVGLGGTNTFSRTNYIVGTNPPPVFADFSAVPTNGLVPLSVSFTNLSNGATNYTWDLGDGNFSSTLNPSHTYTNAGNYTVSLTAVGLGGTNTLTRTNYIVVTNPPPVIVDFSATPTNGLAPLSVSFTNLSSGATNYTWNFGDGNSSNAANPSNIYTIAGIYTVSLSAVGLGGTNSLTLTNYITVTNPPPVIADFSAAPTNGLVPLSVSFTNLTSGATNYSWDFGDGNFSSAENPTNVYINAGTYTVSLSAVGLGGTNSVTLTNYITVTNPPVIADFTGSPTNGYVPITVLFTNLSSGATNYSWNFGDSSTSTAANPSHTYTNPGNFTVSLTAIGLGGTNTLTIPGYVSAQAPPPIILTAALSGTDILLSFQSVSNQSYDVQYKNAQSNASWELLESVLGNGGTLTVITSLTNSDQRFYRVRVP